MFLVNINDINENITSSVRLFTDNCVIYKTITSPQDSEQLQEDLHKLILCELTQKWQMKINVDKCAVLRCTRSLNPIQYTYTLSNCSLSLNNYKSCTYLGVTFHFDNTMSWSSHILYKQ